MTYLNRHSIVVKCEAPDLLKEIILWGEAVWWPKRSLMSFKRLTKDGVKKGTRYRQIVLMPLAPSWDVEVDDLTDTSITRRFLNGMFSGFETVCIKSGKEGFEVSYEMHYDLRGILNKVLWPVIFRRLHDANIEAILHNLKQYLESN